MNKEYKEYRDEIIEFFKNLTEEEKKEFEQFKKVHQFFSSKEEFMRKFDDECPLIMRKFSINAINDIKNSTK